MGPNIRDIAIDDNRKLVNWWEGFTSWPSYAERRRIARLSTHERNLEIVRCILAGGRNADVGRRYDLAAQTVSQIFSDYRAERGLAQP